MTSTTTTGLSAAAVVESLTGYDEQKIEQQFGAPVEALNGARFMRALLFGHFLHQGVEAKQAYKQVMSMTQAEVGDYFVDEKPDDDENGDQDAAADDAGPAAPEPTGATPPPPPAAARAGGRPVGDAPQA